MNKFSLGLLSALAIIGSAYAIFIFTDNTVELSEQPPMADESQIVGGDKDAHGCIGSAGYSWCESRDMCLRVWEIGCPMPTDNDEITTALYKKNNWPKNLVSVTISTNDGRYASGTVSSQGSGGYFYAAKINGAWAIVADGNGYVPCSSLSAFPDYPNSLIPECYNENTDKIVSR